MNGVVVLVQEPRTHGLLIDSLSVRRIWNDVRKSTICLCHRNIQTGNKVFFSCEVYDAVCNQFVSVLLDVAVVTIAVVGDDDDDVTVDDDGNAAFDAAVATFVIAVDDDVVFNAAGVACTIAIVNDDNDVHVCGVTDVVKNDIEGVVNDITVMDIVEMLLMFFSMAALLMLI